MASRKQGWQAALLDELTDEREDERRDFVDAARDPFESEHGPEMGTDGDDNPDYAKPKAAMVTDKVSTYGSGPHKGQQKDITKPGDIVEQVVLKPAESNPAGEMVDAGHGFVVKNFRSREWKTARRTHCKHCGGPLPEPDVSGKQYRCEFGTDALMLTDCKCSGCTLRQLVTRGAERNRGHPRKYCGEQCRDLADNERDRWRTAVKNAVKRGEVPPAEPKDRGLKFVLRVSMSSVEGRGHRY